MTNLWKCCDFLAAAKVDLSCVLCGHVCVQIGYSMLRKRKSFGSCNTRYLKLTDTFQFSLPSKTGIEGKERSTFVSFSDYAFVICERSDVIHKWILCSTSIFICSANKNRKTSFDLMTVCELHLLNAAY